MHNLIEYSDIYSKTSRDLWQYYRNEPFKNNNGVVFDITDDPKSPPFENNRSDKKWWEKRCSNNGTIKIFK